MGESIDPIGYDVAELRELALARGDRYVDDGFLWPEPPESSRTRGPTEYDRPVSWTGSLDERQKPYLSRLPDDERGRHVVREWLQGLVDQAGSGAAVEALSYYESLGWFTEAVRGELEDYLLAVGYRSGGSLADLSRADHIEGLARTARLAQLTDPEREEATGQMPPEGDEEGKETATDDEGPGFEFGTRTG